MINLPILNNQKEKNILFERPMYVASETFGTTVMNTNEVYLFVKSAMESNGGNMEKALDDAVFIDNLMHYKRLYLAFLPNLAYTRSGNLKRKFSWLDEMEKMIDGYVNEQIQKNK